MKWRPTFSSRLFPSLKGVAGALALFGALASLGACDDDFSGRRQFLCADSDIFVKHVSPVMEKRCGMLDCHGSLFRPMRLYGETGLRHIAEANYSGGVATTAVELQANYVSICSVEPEKTDQVARDPGGQAVNRMLLVKKARGQEGHKGGQVFNAFDDSDLCVVGWLRGDNEIAVAEACQKALAKLP